jgi:hypothetical protein
MTTILLAVLAHVIADFLLQTSTMAAKKNNLKISGYLIHGLIVFGTLAILLLGYDLRTALLYSAIICLLHILTDFLKGICCKSGNQTVDLVSFLIDQGIHLAVLLYVWPFFNWRPNPVISSFYQHLFPPKAIIVFQQSHLTKNGLNIDHFLAGAIVYILVCFGGAVLIRKILNIVNNTAGQIKAQQKAGATIGLVERLIILTLVLNGALGSIAFILTAKSIARFNELNDKNFAEYYLIGTLTSTALAICGGIFLKFLMSL